MNMYPPYIKKPEKDTIEKQLRAWKSYALELEWKLEEIAGNHVKMMKGDNLERRH